MKKTISLLLAITLLFSSCTKSNTKTLDLAQAVANIDALTSVENGEDYPLFAMVVDIDDATAAANNIDLSLLEDYAIRLPMVIVKANLYIIAKPVEGKEEEAKAMFEEFMLTQERTWENYLPDQYQLVMNRMETEIDGYLIYIISSDNDAVLQAIKNAEV